MNWLTKLFGRTSQNIPPLKLTGHTSLLRSVAVSPDGRRVLTGSLDHTAKVWDAASGTNLLTIAGHSSPVTAVAYSHDGTRLVTASDDKTLKTWDAATGQELVTFVGHGYGISSTSFSPDDLCLVSGADGITHGQAIVWDAVSGRQIFSLDGVYYQPIKAVAYSPDGSLLATAEDDMGKPGQVRLWDARTGELVKTLSAIVAGIQSVTFSSDGQRVIGGAGEFDSMFGTMKLGGSGVAPIWDMQSGRLVRNLTCHVDQVAAVAFSADGKWIVTGGTGPMGGEVKVWDSVSGKELRTLESHAGDVFALAIFPDGKKVVAGCKENAAIVWTL